MAGTTGKYVYNSDITGTAFSVRMPTWEAGLQTAVAATTEPPLPRGHSRRKRFYKLTVSGREGNVTVLSVGDTLWTDTPGTAVSVPALGSGTALAGTLTGNTGERRKAI